MKIGWLVVNHFLKTDKFLEHYHWLRAAAEAKNISFSCKTGVELLIEGEMQDIKKPDFILFWDKDVRLAARLEQAGLRLFNNAKAIALCDDKSLTQLTLDKEISMPKTIFAPLTYPAVGYPDLSFVKKAVDVLGLPMVIKECFGSFGQQVHLAETIEQAEEIAKSLAGSPFMFQKFIAASRGRDVRLQVVGDKVVAAMLRQNDEDFRANLSNGGHATPYAPDETMKALALKACRVLGLDFAGVDFLFEENGEPILCEINSNAHFKNLYDCTGVNVAAAIIEWIDGQTN